MVLCGIHPDNSHVMPYKGGIITAPGNQRLAQREAGQSTLSRGQHLGRIGCRLRRRLKACRAHRLLGRSARRLLHSMWAGHHLHSSQAFQWSRVCAWHVAWGVGKGAQGQRQTWL